METFRISLPRGELAVSVLRFAQSALVSVDDGARAGGSLAIGVPPLPEAGAAAGAGPGGEPPRPAALALSAEPLASPEQLESLAEKATAILGCQCILRMAVGDPRVLTAPADAAAMERGLLEGLRALRR